MRPCIRVELTEEQENTLKMWANSGKTEQRLALRAKVILLAAQRVGVKGIQERIGLNWQSCLKWRKRFLALGIDGLYDKSGRGRQQKIAPEERTGIIALACTTPALSLIHI